VTLQRVQKPGHPALMPVFQKRQDEVVFAGKVPVKGDFGDPGLRNDPVDPGGPDTVPVVQLMRGEQHAFASGQTLHRQGGMG
jgi:hypothetical protein